MTDTTGSTPTRKTLSADARSGSRRRRRWTTAIALVSGAAVLAALTGCSGGGGGADGGNVTLTYGMWDDAQEPAMKEIIADFEKENPNITVKINLTPWDSYWTKLQTVSTSGTAPDVFWMMEDLAKLYANGGVLMPLDDQIKKDNVDMSNYYPSTTEAFDIDGKTYGIPKDTNSFGLFYNKKLFADAGVAVPTASWTWTDVETAAQKLTDAKTGVYGIAAPVADVLGYYLTIPQAGGHVISDDGKKSGYDDPATIAGIQYWTDLITKYHASPTVQQLTDTDALTMFTSGKVAMYYGGSWDPVAIAQVPYANENVAIAPLPKGVNSSFYANGIGNVAAAKTKHPAEAWAFLKFLGSKTAAEIQAKTGTVIPAYKGMEEAYASSLPQFDMRVLIDQLPNAKPIPSSLDTAEWANFALKEFTKAWAGEETVAQAGKNAADQMNAALAKEK